MVFAEATSGDLWSAVFTAAITVLGAVTLLIVAAVRHLQKKIEATDTTKVTEEVKQQVSAVYETVNGNGLTGSIRRVEAAVNRIVDTQKTHEEKDDKRFARIEKYMGMPEDK